MKLPKPVVVDFETFGIETRPHYPPAPVGVSIKYPGRQARYFSFGHPVGNNATWDQAAEALRLAWEHGAAHGLLFQNGKFDIDVAETHFGLPRLEWSCYHDTLFLLFLDDPHQNELGLKPSAARLLGLPPDEQDAVGEWLLANQPVPGVKLSKAKSSDHYFGAYIAFAPGDLVGRYANGDVERTEELFKLLYPRTVERGMLRAYDRERELLPILLELERQGVRIDLPRLRDDLVRYEEARAQARAWLLKALKAGPDLNLESGPQLVAALIACGKADPTRLGLTKMGKPKSDKESLLAAVTDVSLLAMLKYLRQLTTCLDTFMGPWHKMATAPGADSRIFTTWNQVKSSEGADAVGTKTGRLSATWFMNMPKEFSPLFAHEEPDPAKRKRLPKCPIAGLPSLPLCRGYIVPWSKDHVLIDRDYSQQEPRILAHFDGGALMEKYLENPWIDFHDYAKAELEAMGKLYDRKPVKNTNLGLIYGMGVGKLAAKNDMTVEEASELKKAILLLYPGLKEMYKDMRLRAETGVPIRTWGGREYYCEEPVLHDGKWIKFDYKMVNKLIQGSAAECTKEAIIRYWKAKAPEDLLYLLVHDEMLASVPRKRRDAAMAIMREAMESVEFDVPMLTEGDVSDKSWAALQTYDKKGQVVHGSAR